MVFSSISSLQIRMAILHYEESARALSNFTASSVLCLVMKSVALAMESEKLMFDVVTI